MTITFTCRKLYCSLALLSCLSPMQVWAASAQTSGNLQISVKEAPLRAHLAFLASDLLEGRGTGQRGGDLTVAYLETQAQVIGLQAANGKSYRQAVNIAGTKALPQNSSLQISVAGKPLPMQFGDDWIWNSGNAETEHVFDHPLVFVGYGVHAPEENWDDYKGLDCHGKILVMLVNDPQPTEAEPNRFGGKALTYYGRWKYKYEEARRRGAAGVLLIHTDASANYGWGVVKNGGLIENFQILEAAANGKFAGNPLQGWITNAFASQLFQAAGFDLERLRSAAERKDFQPQLLNAQLTGTSKTAVRQIEQFNVAWNYSRHRS